VTAMNHKLDTDSHVFFYEAEFYVLSNFSAFRLEWMERDFDTSEHAYHWSKFDPATPGNAVIRLEVAGARSAHEAFKLAKKHKDRVRPNWNALRVKVMRDILRAKADQHEYVRRKLLQTGDRELVEDSWRDPFWGWGEDRTGLNMLGKLWMEIRAELRASE
jgi:ribA/ribD-fused uncharacterized protein